MDTLKELLKIVNRKRLSKVDVFDKTFFNQNHTNLYLKLYEGLEKGIITNDETAADYIYGNADKDAKFRKLKSRFKVKMQKTVLLLDTDEVFINPQSRAFYECTLNNQIIEIIIKISGTTKLVYELVKENYAKAEQFKFYDILKNYSYYLLSYYALSGNIKEFSKEQELYLKYIELAQKEQYAKFLYFKASIQFENQAPITDALLDDVFKILNEFKLLKTELRNTEIEFFYYYLSLEYLQKSNKINELIDICNDADNYMIMNPASFTNTRKVIILIYKLSALLSAKKYEDGIQLIQNEAHLDLPENNFNWFLLKEIQFKLYLQHHDIEQATNVYDEVLQNKSFKRQSERLIERWKILYAYLVFMDYYLNKGAYKFSLAKFLNEVPVNSKDKSGFNFAIRMLEVLFHAAKNDFNLIFAKMDALRSYRSRYLNDNTYKRNHLLLSLMLKAEKSGFNYKDLKNADWYEIAELRKPNQYIIAEWEIIPYEVLWDIFVSFAQEKRTE